MAVDDAVKVSDALRNLYAEHQLPADGGEHEAWFHVRIGPVSIPLPNPPARQRAVFVHDVNHVLTGYNAAFSDGEMSIAAFEIGAGCGRVWVAWFLNLSLMALGAVFRPRAVFRAFARGRDAGSLYVEAVPRAVLNEMTVGEVRRLIRLDEQPSRSNTSHYAAFAFRAGMTWLAAIALGALLVAGASWSVARLTGS
jgi:hypothetical protein